MKKRFPRKNIFRRDRINHLCWLNTHRHDPRNVIPAMGDEFIAKTIIEVVYYEIKLLTSQFLTHRYISEINNKT